ncbi:acyl-CoA synthetase [Rhodococcus rhodochrous]|uniref:Acyl-CoA synthetase n=1 Tax=Rhodococcus rhodochrous TaxID=1829 RepID=A0AAW4XNG5_RHORH|nr:acyl-CoA synthetase [Rhodococcus rhodochrous]MCD2114725.1 acyl-CoA synthetase [Rhodococcus rhodochrous]
MYPAVHAAVTPDKPAVILAGSEQLLTYGQLETRSCQLANAFRDVGLVRGDVVALLSTNAVEVFEVYWACLRSGLYLTPINSHLAVPEVAYVVDDCDAKVLVVSADLADIAASLVDSVPQVHTFLAYGGDVPRYTDYHAFVAAGSPIAPENQPRGADMLYSSGTTGRPKGVKPSLPSRQVSDPGDPYVAVFGGGYSMGDDSVYLSPAPLYHAAPLRFGMVVQSLGGTVITTRKFDPEQCLWAIDEYGVTHSQWVPTHFVRLLRLPRGVRESYDLTSQTHAIHAAAPCPVEVKKEMMAWFGPILHEYYASTEANGITMIGPTEWADKPGSVGKAKLGVIHVCDDDGAEVPAGETGLVYFEREAMPFAYHGDPEKTASAQHPTHPTWSTCGDIGFMDEDGYLFLRDRKAFTIISGGVNIYPQEIEDCLVLHPDVFDVAVVGIPDPEFGESVLAVVQLAADVQVGQDVSDRLFEHLRSNIAGYKIPRRIEFTDSLPRTPTGKLVKRELQQKYSSLAASPSALTESVRP